MKKLILLLLSALGCIGATPDFGITEVATVSDLLNLNPNTSPSTVYVDGFYSLADGGEGLFHLVNNTTSTNTGTKIALLTSGWSAQRMNLSDTVNAAMFGVKLNDASAGVVNRSALTSALTYVITNHKRLYQPSGICYVNGNVTIAQATMTGWIWEGSGPIYGQSTVQWTGSAVTDGCDIGTDFSTQDVSYFAIKNITFDGGASPISAYTLNLDAGRYFTIEGCGFNGVKSGATALKVSRHDILVRNNFFKNFSSHFTGTALELGGFLNNCIIDQQNMFTYFHVGIFGSYVNGYHTGLTIDNNTFDNVDGPGIEIITGIGPAQITRNYFEDCGYSPVSVTRAGGGTDSIAAPIILAHNQNSSSHGIRNTLVARNWFKKVSGSPDACILISGGAGGVVVTENEPYHNLAYPFVAAGFGLPTLPAGNSYGTDYVVVERNNRWFGSTAYATTGSGFVVGKFNSSNTNGWTWDGK